MAEPLRCVHIRGSAYQSAYLCGRHNVPDWMMMDTVQCELEKLRDLLNGSWL
jgi:hypothetical protein